MPIILLCGLVRYVPQVQNTRVMNFDNILPQKQYVANIPTHSASVGSFMN